MRAHVHEGDDVTSSNYAHVYKDSHLCVKIVTCVKILPPLKWVVVCTYQDC